MKLYKRVGKVVLDGSENWLASSLTVPNYKGFYTNTNFQMFQHTTGKCNYFQYKTNSDWGNLVQAEFVENAINSIGIRVKETLASTVEDFKTWL